MLVRDYMTRKVSSLREDATLLDAALLIRHSGKRHGRAAARTAGQPGKRYGGLSSGRFGADLLCLGNGCGIFRYHLHLLPIVGELFSAIQTNNVGAGDGSRSRLPPSGLAGNGKTIVLVPAPKKHIHQTRDHVNLLTPDRPASQWFCLELLCSDSLDSE